jgi:erythromycin esterase
MVVGAERTYEGANIRDAAMAENVEWILQREDRIVIGAANGHIQREPFLAPPFVSQGLTMVGQHLAATLGERMVVIASTFGGGTFWLHRPGPDSSPGHSEPFVDDVDALAPDSLDALLATARVPLYLLDLRKVPGEGPVAERFAAASSTMNGPHAQLVNPMVAFDAVVYIDRLTPWHTFIDTST